MNLELVFRFHFGSRSVGHVLGRFLLIETAGNAFALSFTTPFSDSVF